MPVADRIAISQLITAHADTCPESLILRSLPDLLLIPGR